MQPFPFIFHKDISIRYAGNKRTGAAKDIRVMFEKQFLDETDTLILLHLQKYGHLNAFLIRALLSRQMEKCTSEFCSNRLKKLEKLGFVVRFLFTYNDESGKEHSTPYIYNLSESARKLFKNKNDRSFVNNTPDIDYIQRKLSFNQFHIMFEGQYDGALKYSSYGFNNEYDGLYKFTTNSKSIVLYVFSIRTTPEWEKSYLERLRKLKEHLYTGGYSFSGIMVICESEMQSLRAERCRSGDKQIADLEVYYLTDYASVAEGSILQYVIQVKPENDFSSYDIIKINVDGPVKENNSQIN